MSDHTVYNLEFLSDRNFKRTKTDIEKDCCSLKELHIKEYTNAVVASRKNGGPGVFTEDGYVKETDFNYCAAERRQPVDDSDIPVVDEEVVFIGTLSGVYGHVITDNLKHLWILLGTSRFQKLKFVYCRLREEEPVPELFFQILELLGKSRDEVMRIEAAQRFRRVYVPDQCFFAVPGGKLYRSGDRFYTPEYIKIIDRIKAASASMCADCEVSKKLYFTRTALTDNGRRDFGEYFIEEAFRKMGYTIIAPERISFVDQVNMLSHCEEFAATQGSVSLNAVFCDKDAHVTLINKQNYNTPYQLAINEVRGGNYTVIDANRSILNLKKTPWAGPFFMYRSKEFCRFASMEYKGLPKREFAEYVFLSVPKCLRGLLRQVRNDVSEFARRFSFGRLLIEKYHFYHRKRRKTATEKTSLREMQAISMEKDEKAGNSGYVTKQ